MKKHHKNASVHSVSPAVKERKSDVLKRSVVDTFIALVGKIGFEATTLDLVAKELDMRRNHVGYYFPSRASLLSAAAMRVISLGQQITIQKIQLAKDPSEAIEAWVGAAFDWLELFPHHGKVMLAFYSQCPFEKSFAKLNSDIWEIGIDRIAALLEEMKFPITREKLKERLRETQTFNLGVIIQKLTSSQGESWEQCKLRAVTHARTRFEPLKRRKESRT